MMPDLLRAGFALGIVILLILALGWALRRFGNTGVRRMGKRLAVIESLALDPRRRLVLVRRDGEEHLLLLGPAGDIVVGAARAAPAEETTAADEDTTAEREPGKT
ncbi:flagellar biosynthetic protein FliO [Zavarzinia compransoris]|uniref:flagellar biosynthetic protein FliO n=1 Tax=Zavarzinia marina TaxID=2911065 RepID=UPI001F3105A1|nr:flagellar biosynthetic protein FliO [Zavarzinia marina]MCF4166569.1 flagellar biosynthetic protein FliO [Zavarzinia marina]